MRVDERQLWDHRNNVAVDSYSIHSSHFMENISSQLRITDTRAAVCIHYYLRNLPSMELRLVDAFGSVDIFYVAFHCADAFVRVVRDEERLHDMLHIFC